MPPNLPSDNETVAARAATTDALVTVAWRRKGWLVIGLAVGLATAAACNFVLPAAYQSTAQIAMVMKGPDGVTDVPRSAAEFVAPPAEALKSSLILDSAIRSGGLAARGLLGGPDGDPVARLRAALAIVAVKTPAGHGNLLKLSYRAGDPDDSQAVVAAVLDSYRDYLEKKHRAAAGDTVELILRERERLQKELAAQEADYRAFRERAPLLGKARDGLEFRQERLNSIQAKRSALLLQEVEVEAQLTAVTQAQKEGRSPDAILIMLTDFARKSEAIEPGPHRQATLQEQLLPLLLEERKLLETHGAKHPDVLAARARVEEARRRLLLPLTAWQVDRVGPAAEDAIRAHVDLLRQKLAQLKIAEGLLAAAFEQEQGEARRLAAYEIENEARQTAITLNRQLYEALVKRLGEASLVRDAGGYQVEVVEPPAAGKRVSPNVPLNLAVGAVLGLVAGLLAALAADRRPRRTRRAPERATAHGVNGARDAVPFARDTEAVMTNGPSSPD